MAGTAEAELFLLPPLSGFRSRILGRRQRNGRLRRQQQEGESLLQVQPDGRVRVAQIADRYVLADVKPEVAAAGREHERARDRRGPDDLAVDDALDMLQH